jgi:carbon monoxide dehydrogenase subunit G
MLFGRAGRWFGRTCLLAALGAALPDVAHSADVTASEMDRLRAREAVIQEHTFERDGRRYIGGASYVLIDAAPARVLAALDDVRAYRRILPRTRSVRWIGLSRRGDVVVELEQGTPIAHGRFTVRVRRDRRLSVGADTVRFWLDRRFEHDIADANGYFRVEPTDDGKTLLTYVVEVDLGSGIFKRLFEERIRAAALSTPLLVRAYVEGH